MITEAIILCGGNGTRMGSDIPKALHKVNGIELILRQIKWLRNNGIEKIILACSESGYRAIHYIICETYPQSNINFSVELTKLGTGGAVKSALQEITGERFLICNVDDLTDVNLTKMSDVAKNVIALGNFKCPYGVAMIDSATDVLTGFEEKKLLKDIWVSIGVSIVTKEQIEPLLPDVGSLEYDVYPKMFFGGYKHKGYWWPVNDQKQRFEAEEYFAKSEM